jgi:hypothetical protein
MKVIRLNESDIQRIVKRVLNEGIEEPQQGQSPEGQGQSPAPEGLGDLNRLYDNADKIKELMDKDTPYNRKIELGTEIKADLERPNIWGYSYTAKERLEGAAESISSLIPIVRHWVPDDPAPLDIDDTTKLLKSILGQEEDVKKIVDGISSVARRVGVKVI